MQVWDEQNRWFTDDMDMLMNLSGLDHRMGFEGVGIQDDGTPVIFDKCGNFGYLDTDRFSVKVDLFSAE